MGFTKRLPTSSQNGRSNVMSEQVVNLTSSTVYIWERSVGITPNAQPGQPIIVASFEPSGNAANVAVRYHKTGRDVNGIPVVVRTYGAVSGLPRPDGRTYIVNEDVLRTVGAYRMDLVTPDRSDESWRVINGKGCVKRFRTEV
jgi:hypothetical protein